MKKWLILFHGQHVAFALTTEAEDEDGARKFAEIICEMIPENDTRVYKLMEIPI